MGAVMEPVQKICLWGGPGSGKTTYLGALALAAYLSNTGDWVINGLDPGSIQFLQKATSDLKSGSFPGAASTSTASYSFQIRGRIMKKKGMFSFLNQYEQIDLVLQVTDRPGKDFIDYADEIAKDLAGCGGLILMYDYDLDQTDNPNFEYVQGALEFLRVHISQNLLPGSRLPHYLAVCLSKYDHEPTFRWLLENQLVGWYAGDDHRNIPYLDEPRRALSRLDNLILPLLERNFDPPRIAYFGVSSIGFFHRQDGGVETNVRIDKNVKTIRSGRAIYPLNVLSPLIWLAERLNQPEKVK